MKTPNHVTHLFENILKKEQILKYKDIPRKSLIENTDFTQMFFRYSIFLKPRVS